jgi:drug/metabolite transporter (DMT)-like permease
MMLLRERLRMGQWLGLALGVADVALVVGEAALESPARFQGLVLAFVGVLGLVAGTLYFGRFCRGPSATRSYGAVPVSRRRGLTVASANFYLVPGTAALLAWLLLGERLGSLALIGLITASVGCWLVNARSGKPLPKEM